MLLKLLKYDFRAMWKQFSLIWGAALALALVNRFTLFRDTENSRNSGLLMFAFGVVIAAMFVICISFVLDRFGRGLLGSEGYLMHTLPVRPWELVASKLICGTVTWIISGWVALISPLLMVPFQLSDLLQFPWVSLLQEALKHPDMLALVTEFCLALTAFIVLLIAVMYLSMAVGHLFSRHRKFISVAAFIGLYILLVNVYSRVFSSRLVMPLTDALTANAHGAMLAAAAAMLIPAGLFLAAVCWILEHKLNLE